MLLAVEQLLDALGLLIGEQRSAGVQGAPCGIQWVALVLTPLGLLAVGMLRRKRGYVVKDRQSLITLNASLPGTTAPIMASTAIVLLAMYIAFSAAPSWATIAAGAIAGVFAALLMRRSEIRQVAGFEGWRGHRRPTGPRGGQQSALAAAAVRSR